MANVVNKLTGEVRLLVSPVGLSSDWTVNPLGIDALLAADVPYYYWVVVLGGGVAGKKSTGDAVREMDAGEKAVVNAARLPGQKAVKIEQFAQQTRQFVVSEGYDDTAKQYLTALLTDAYGTNKANRAAYITDVLTWINTVQVAYGTAKDQCNTAADKTALDAVTLDLTSFESTNPDVTPEDALTIPN